MTRSLRSSVIAIGIMAAAMTLCPSCSTGIESTKKIRMTKEDVRLMVKSPEQKFAESIQGTPLSEWKPGKQFMAMSDRTLLLFEPTSLTEGNPDMSIKGKILSYVGLDSHISPDLK